MTLKTINGGGTISSSSLKKYFSCAVILIFVSMCSITSDALVSSRYDRNFSLRSDDRERELIVFVSNRDGNSEIYTMNKDGSDLKRLTHNPADELFPSWSPDDQKIVFSSGRDGNEEIYKINLDRGPPVRLTNHGASDRLPKWQPRSFKAQKNE